MRGISIAMLITNFLLVIAMMLFMYVDRFDEESVIPAIIAFPFVNYSLVFSAFCMGVQLPEGTVHDQFGYPVNDTWRSSLRGMGVISIILTGLVALFFVILAFMILLIPGAPEEAYLLDGVALVFGGMGLAHAIVVVRKTKRMF